MRKLILLFALLFMGVIAKAQPAFELTLFDNGTAGFFYDVKGGEAFTGASTALFKIYYVAFEIGGITTTEESDKIIFLPGINLLVGDFLYNTLPPVKKVCDDVSTLGLLIKKLTLGGFWTKDFIDTNREFYGFYSALKFYW